MTFRIATALAGCLAAATPQPAPASGPPCEARALLEPARAFVGQAVRHRAVVLRREDVGQLSWEEAPRFPGFRVERLTPGALAPGFVRDGRAWLRVEAWAALFPARPGTWRLPDARLRCGEAGLVDLPGPRFEAREVPRAGRPEGWDGLVGPVTVAASLAPTELALGGSVRVTVRTTGEANLWDARPRMPAPDGVEVLPRPPRIERSRGETLRVLRIDALDWVPRRAGTFRPEPVRLAWFDPATERYRESTAALPAVRVRPEPGIGEGAAAGEGAEPAGMGPAGSAGGDGGRGRPARWALVVLVAGVLTAVLCVVRAARRRAVARDPVRRARAAARRAARRRDVAAESAALERGLRALMDPETDGPVARAAGDALARLERARFSPDGGDADAARDAARRLLAGGAAPAAGQVPPTGLR